MTDDEPAWTQRLLTSPHNTPGKGNRIRRMFNGIAPRYELVNSLFSLGRDAAWRRRSVTLAGTRPDDRVLDIACGTGDFARAFASVGASVVGVDFAHEMLLRALNRVGPAIRWCEGDALCLPFRSSMFTVVSCAFGVRNFEDLGAGLREMHRVLRPGGRAVILEFNRPQGALTRRLYEFYSNRVMPLAATIISGDRQGAYRYLPRSVVSFLSVDQLCLRLRRVGFDQVHATPLTIGAVTAYIATRS